jgi:hypothetical protein
MLKISGFLTLNQGESYLNIFKLLTVEACGTYSILIKILLEYKIPKFITLNS